MLLKKSSLITAALFNQQCQCIDCSTNVMFQWNDKKVSKYTQNSLNIIDKDIFIKASIFKPL